MFEMLLRFIFTVVSNMMQMLMSPFISVIVNMFPDVQAHFINIAHFLSSAFTYLTTIYRWFLFTTPMFLALFDYFAIKFSIWVVACAVRAGLKFYNTLKP